MSIRPVAAFVVAPFLLLTSGVLDGIAEAQQSLERTRYSTLVDWTVTTYRSDAQAFLRCSAERHYDNGLALTVSRNTSGYVLGFTSSDWPYEDRSTHSVSVGVDSGASQAFAGRVRLLTSGPIVFVDLEADSPIIPAIAKGRMLQVESPETNLDFDLTGSAAAVSSLLSCHRDGAE